MRSQDDAAEESHLRKAIALAKNVPLVPFGAVIIDGNGNVVGRGWNRSAEDPTAHAEIEAIRDAAKFPNLDWGDCTLYTTAEPCPMCQSGILWAGIPRMRFGTSIHTLIRLGWKQIDLSATDLTRLAPFASCSIVGGICEAECDALFHNAMSIRSARPVT